MKYVAYFFWLVLLVLGLLFASLNAHRVEVHYYFGTSTIALPLLLTVTLAIGLALGWLMTVPRLIRAWWVSKRCRQQVKKRDEELAALAMLHSAPEQSEDPGSTCSK